MKERKLPEGWEWKRLGDICKTTSGGTPARNNETYFNGNIPWLKSGELENNIIYSTEEAISQEGLKNSSTKIIPKGTPLIALYGATVGKVGILGIDCAINQAICAVFPSNKIDSLFLFHFLIKSRPKFLDLRAGGAQPNISQDIVKNIKIPLPPLPIQRQIVAVLEKAEAVKRQRQEVDALTGALLQSVFFEMFGDPVRNDKGYPKKKLGDVCLKIQDGTHYSPEDQTGEIPYITAKNIRRWGIDLSTATYVSKHIHEKIYSRCDPKKGDVIYIKDGVTAGLAKVNKFDFEFSMLSSIAMIRPDINKLNPFYLEHYLNHPNVYEKIMERKSGSAITRIILREIREIPMVLPPLALQQQFARVVQDVERIRERQVASGKEIKGLCEGLMQRAFAGELIG